jgi:hypothetical protein
MSPFLKNIHSIINSYKDANDKERVFTFIEFIKEFGYENTPKTFLTYYKEYLSEWSKAAQNQNKISDEEITRENLIKTLKSIVLTYSSYEEQDFVANLKWDDPEHQKAIVPFFAEKIKKICDFYKTKRNELHLTIRKNNIRGSRSSIEQIIYDKIVDFYFNNKNLAPQIKHLQDNLSISIEQYVDIYSDYFDIPRHKKCTNESRKKLLEANINNVNYEDYLEISKVISDTLYSGEVYLEEIPLIAQIALDFSAECAGDLKQLRDQLLYDNTLNQVSLNDQVALRRALYRKFLGCDLYYIYSDGNKNIIMDKLVTASNPSGNLLNCGTADTAVIESNELKLLSQIGLFFKPEKTGILKILANDFSWEIDETKILPDTFYVFPDPSKYGDIGNNKDRGYPLIMEYKLDGYIKNLSSGSAKDDPMNFICTTTWNSYYTRQEDELKLISNNKFNYSFTNLANQGIIQRYQTDLYGNEYALVKGYTITLNGNKISHIETPIKYPLPGVSVSQLPNLSGVLLNGGYFVDTRYEYKEKDIRKPFDYSVKQRLATDYIWSGVQLKHLEYTTPDVLAKIIDAGTFEPHILKFVDHYQSTSNTSVSFEDNNNADDLDKFKTKYNAASDISSVVDKSFEDLRLEGTNCILFKLKNDIESPIKKITFTKDSNDKLVINYDSDIQGLPIVSFDFIEDIFIVELASHLAYFRYFYDGLTFTFEKIRDLPINASGVIKTLYNEKERTIYEVYMYQPDAKNYLAGTISSFNLDNNSKFNTIVNINEYDSISSIPSSIPDKSIFVTLNDFNGENNFDCDISPFPIKSLVFSYNTNLDKYLLAYVQHDANGTPTIFEHTFRLFNRDRFFTTLKSKVYRSHTNDVYIYDSEGLTNTPTYVKNIEKIPFFITL